MSDITVKTRVIVGVSKKTGKGYRAIECLATDGEHYWKSGYVFPRWRPCDAEGHDLQAIDPWEGGVDK